LKGHQDKGQHPLDVYATINIYDDAQDNTKNLNNRYTDQNYELENEIWKLQIEGEKIGKNIDKQVRDHIYKPIMQTYWDKKTG
jgi:hypothetical protein